MWTILSLATKPSRTVLQKVHDDKVAHVSWWKITGFVRGFMAAGGLLGVSATILPYEALDLVSGVHAVIVGWRSLADAIGSFIGPLFNLPDIQAEIVSSFIIGTAIGPAWAFSILQSEWGQHKGVIQNAAFTYRVVTAFGEAYLWGLMLVSFVFPSKGFFFAALALSISLLGALRRLPTFRSGFFTALGFLMLMEGVYLVSTPSVQGAFDGFVCKNAGDTAPRCQAQSKELKVQNFPQLQD